MLGFYTLRSIPQWIRERRVSDAADPRVDPLLAKELDKNKERLAIDSPVLSSVDAWRDWYQRPNGKRLDADFSVEEAGPLADGRFASNAIAAAISKARADDLHRLVVAELAENKTVLVVYGASPLMIHRPALDAALGPPCFIGADARLGPCR